jgi:prepilin-type N-terminal cleavage/methylation domain-containing protein
MLAANLSIRRPLNLDSGWGGAVTVRKELEAHVRAERTQAGFTLFEIAVVLVIIGLLIGLILSGSAAMKDGETKDVIATVKDISSSTRQFKERYHYLPGDLPKAHEEFADLVETDCANADLRQGLGNGLIDTNMDVAFELIPPDVEISCAPVHLAKAGLIRDPGGPIVKKYHDGEVRVLLVARKSSAFKNSTSYPVIVQNLVQLSSVPLRAALGLDSALDDGNLRTGQVQGCKEDFSAFTAAESLPEFIPYVAAPL